MKAIAGIVFNAVRLQSDTRTAQAFQSSWRKSELFSKADELNT